MLPVKLKQCFAVFSLKKLFQNTNYILKIFILTPHIPIIVSWKSNTRLSSKIIKKKRSNCECTLCSGGWEIILFRLKDEKCFRNWFLFQFWQEEPKLGFLFFIHFSRDIAVMSIKCSLGSIATDLMAGAMSAGSLGSLLAIHRKSS